MFTDLNFHIKYNLAFKLVLASVGFGLVMMMWFLAASIASAASYSVSPASGTYAVGSTFEVSILLNTQNQNINAVNVQLSFPPDKLQLVSPSTGNSIIGIYTTPPKYDNNAGRVEIVGGIPNGINVSSGLISKLTFRVKGIGTAGLRFSGDSQVLLNDGRGTNVLESTNGSVLKLELPPQQGPLVISETHPDQESWYKNSNVSLKWDVGLPVANGYSYMISDNPTDVPDDTPDSTDTTVAYKQVPDGVQYFHIKAFRDGRWGGVSRYSLRIDQSEPADFAIEVIPSTRTTALKPIFQFTSSDNLSGLDHYEIKIVPLKISGRNKSVDTDQLFIDSPSPYVTPELMYGTYQVIVRAYDKAGNIREQTQKFEITDSFLWFIGQDGIVLPFFGQVKWKTVSFPLLAFLVILLVIAYFIYRHYQRHHQLVAQNALPSTIKTQLEELKKYQSRYGKIVAVVTLAFFSVWLSGQQVNRVRAQEQVFIPATEQTNVQTDAPVNSESNSQSKVLESPIISSVSSNIKDDELFYVSGRTTEPNSTVVVHLQSLVDGSAYDFTTSSDRRGDWSYRHTSALVGGKYILWAHVKDGSQLSAPSPQVELDVKPIAINWGNSRVTYQSIYLVAITVLVIVIIALIVFIVIAWVLARRRRRQFAHNVRLTEEGLHHGFMSLKRDLEAELSLMHRANLGAELVGEANVRAQQLRDDLKEIEQLVNREVSQIQTFEHLPPTV